MKKTRMTTGITACLIAAALCTAVTPRPAAAQYPLNNTYTEQQQLQKQRLQNNRAPNTAVPANSAPAPVTPANTANNAGAADPNDKTVYSQAIPGLPLMQGMTEEQPKPDPDVTSTVETQSGINQPLPGQTRLPSPQQQIQQQRTNDAAGMPASTTADIKGNDKQVITYYRQALTDRGWKPTDGTMHSYERNGQKIVIDTDYQNGHTIVRFRMAPDQPGNGLAIPQNGGVKYNTPLSPQTNPNRAGGTAMPQQMRN
jgi:hypothetical protein